MRRKPALAFAAVAAMLMSSVCFALWGVADSGVWPDSWPEQLDRLRAQSRTLRHRVEIVHEIPFTDRAEFEAAWPHILTVKSRLAPLVLLRSPDKWLGNAIKAGVRVRCPDAGELVTPQGRSYPPGSEASIPDGQYLKVGPPWPDDISSDSGGLPEYVVIENGKWRASASAEFKALEAPKVLSIRRARTQIELIVDGDIVDLNRIRLPADTPIIDKRFPEDDNEADAGGG